MRGFLIFPFVAELYRLDRGPFVPAPGPGPDPRAYDDDFREGVLVDQDEDGLSERVRREHAPVRLPCQVEADTYEALARAAAGHTPRSSFKLVLHFADLEREGLVEPQTGEARVRVGDRLGAIYDKAGVLVQSVRTPPGLYVTEARPVGWGLDPVRPTRNLLLLTLGDRSPVVPRLA
jgi:hypothetical protein